MKMFFTTINKFKDIYKAKKNERVKKILKKNKNSGLSFK